MRFSLKGGDFSVWQVVGQNKVIAWLEHSLKKSALAHAYLLIGPAHVGKKTLALNLAQALNCQAAEPPCGECASCQKIASLKHADVQIIGLNHNGNLAEERSRVEISIDQIRELQHSSSLPPFEGKYKVFIIDQAELMSNEAANCLLKTLEEPIGRVVFMLLTANERLLPETVISRCLRLELLPLKASEVEQALISHWEIEPEKAKLLGRLSHGCLGWALSAASNEGLLAERTEKIQRLLDIISTDYEGRFSYATELAAKFNKNRRLALDELDLWLFWWHDLMMIKTGCAESITNVDFEAKLNKLAQVYNLAQIRTFISSIMMAADELKQNANPQLVLEVLMLNIPRREAKIG